MNILLIGYGKMGKVIEKCAKSRAWNIWHIIDHPENWNTMPRSEDPLVAIEFTDPHAVLDNLQNCIENRIPVVCGTTGWYDHLHKIEKLVEAHKGSLLYAPNFSRGVNMVFAINRWLAQNLEKMPSYSVSISEYHHQHKLDSPSGTAIKMANDVISMHKGLNTWTQSLPAEAGQIPVTSVRNGEIPGTHCIQWDSPEDSIRIIHEAKSRSMFAEGALDAAAWLYGKQGIYTYEQMLFPADV